MAINNVLAVVTVTDFDSSLGWYERLMGCPADRFPMDGLAEWQVTETGGLQLLRDADRSGGALLTLVVDDLQEHITDLASRDLSAGPITRGDIGQFASMTDPEGNTITFAEVLGKESEGDAE